MNKNAGTSSTSTSTLISGTGSLGTLPPAQTTAPPTRPSSPVLHTSPSQPYATNAPRAGEPVPTPTPYTFTPADQQYQQALAAGLLGNTPNQPAVNQSGMDSGVAFEYNDLTTLNEDQLMQKYTPNYQNIDQTFEPPAPDQGGSTGVAANGTDGVVTVADTGPVTSVPTSTVPSNVIFPVGDNNDPTSLQSYLTQLAATVAPFDISNPANSTLISNAVTDAVSNPTKYQADVAAGQNMLNAIASLPVPSDMLGLEQSYYDLYASYNQLVADAPGVASDSSGTAIQAGNSVQQDSAALGASLETTLNDLNTAQAVVQNVQAGNTASQ